MPPVYSDLEEGGMGGRHRASAPSGGLSRNANDLRSEENNSLQRIGPGKTVSLHFSVCLADGQLLDSTRERPEPAEFTVGDGNLAPGFEKAIFGLKAGDQAATRAVLDGGPVRPDRGYVLHSEDFAAGDATQSVAPGLRLTATRDVLEAVASDRAPASP